jgi:alcohol dehydrogenase class IV
MVCCHHYAPVAGADGAFTVDASRITFGRGCLAELGPRAAAHGLRRVALFTDPRLRALPAFAAALASLEGAGLDVVVYAEVEVEPTDRSFKAAARFAAEARPDGFVSLGGGSVIDTCKAANLYASHPADFLTYVNAPIGAGVPPPGPLRPHIACPTTSGTGSEVTGIAIFDLLALEAKTGIAAPALRPSEALIDPACADTLPGEVVAASGLDVLSHALESYTARPFSRRPAPAVVGRRPLSQGANPWSDIGCREAMTLAGRFLERAVADADDREAREGMMWAATLAGIAFGNAGVHIPHGMSYAIAGLVRDYRPAGYASDAPMVPHGVAVIVNAPAAFRFTAAVLPERHLEAAACLGADTRGAAPADAGAVLSGRLVELMRAVGMPNGAGGVGYHDGDCEALAGKAILQQRLLQNAPCAVDEGDLRRLFAATMRYW